jgi:hypothetical protein
VDLLCPSAADTTPENPTVITKTSSKIPSNFFIFSPPTYIIIYVEYVIKI